MNALNPMPLNENDDRKLRIKDRTLAVLDLAIPFHIIQITGNSLVFRYVGNRQWFKNPDKLDVTYESISLKNIPVETVADYRIPTDMVQTRYHCVRFNNLSQAQSKQLEHFIHICTE